jgi:hypothetical protein
LWGRYTTWIKIGTRPINAKSAEESPQTDIDAQIVGTMSMSMSVGYRWLGGEMLQQIIGRKIAQEVRDRMEYYDKFTGKPFDHATDRLPHYNGSFCEECGSELIDHCIRCGAPVCCPKCCEEEKWKKPIEY